MSKQLEFDLVSPHFAEPANYRRLRDESDLFVDLAAEKAWQANLSVRIEHENLVYGRPGDELDQLAVLIGKKTFKRKTWERRLRVNPTAVRKIIVSMKKLFNLS